MEHSLLSNSPQLSDNTHGGNQGLLKCGKGTTYEGGQRVPGIAWWPGKITPGKTREVTYSLSEIPCDFKYVWNLCMTDSINSGSPSHPPETSWC